MPSVSYRANGAAVHHDDRAVGHRPGRRVQAHGGTLRHGLANIAPRRGWRLNALVADAGPHDPPARTRLQLYQAERRHLVKVSAEAIRCGIEERRVRLAGSEGAMVAEVLRCVFDDPQFGLDTAQIELVRRLAASLMRLLGSSAVEPA